MNNYDELNVLKNLDKVCLISHEDPDADALCSMVVFRNFLIEYMNVKSVDIFSECKETPESYLPILDGLSINDTPTDYNMVIMMDATADDRLGKYSEIFNNANHRIVIDHHKTNKLQGNINIVEVVSSTCELVYKIFNHFTYNPSKEDKGRLYAGTITDTNNLSVGALNKYTFKMISDFADDIDIFSINEYFFSIATLKNAQIYSKAIENIKSISNGQILASFITNEEAAYFNAKPDDYNGIVNRISNLNGCKFAIFIHPKDEEFYISLRCKNSYDVSVIAKKMGGGGHKGASGFTSNKSIECIIDSLALEINNQLDLSRENDTKFKF